MQKIYRHFDLNPSINAINANFLKTRIAMMLNQGKYIK